jgi:hypothetical protein
MSWLHFTTSRRLGVAFFVAAGAALRAPEAACPAQLVPSRRSHFERRRRIALQAEPLAGILLTADMARARYPRAKRGRRPAVGDARPDTEAGPALSATASVADRSPPAGPRPMKSTGPRSAADATATSLRPSWLRFARSGSLDQAALRRLLLRGRGRERPRCVAPLLSCGTSSRPRSCGPRAGPDPWCPVC